MNRHKVGLALGAFAGLVHLVWEVLISLGLAQGLMNFIFTMHSLNNPYTVMPFDLSRAVSLVILTSIIGYIVGSVFALILNKIHR